MADGDYKAPVRVTAAHPRLAAADFVPLGDSNAPGVPNDDQTGNGSASDVSMDYETDDEEAATTSISHPQLAQTALSREIAKGPHPVGREESSARKRKSLESASDNDTGRVIMESAKKVKLGASRTEPRRSGKLPNDRSLVPPEVWHNIFSLCPPKTLGKLLFVNRIFNVYLDPSSAIPCERPETLSYGALSVSKPNAIWQASRRRFWPGMPSPLQDKTELCMWQLSSGSSCQHCGKKPGAPQRKEALDPWHSGPGQDGVAIIWAFATRSCGTCLLSRSIKEIDILLSSSTPSTLTAALPFIFVTQELQAISTATVEKGQPLGAGPLAKLYWSSHVEELKQELFRVKSMGSATAEEWLKGLDGRGSERRNDASRWENWATASEGLCLMRNVLYPGYRPPAIASLSVSMPTAAKQLPAVHIPGLGPTNHNSRAGTPSFGSSRRNGETPDPFLRSSNVTVSNPGRYERTKEEVASLKAARKAEIERRALALDPPLPANVLAHITSFQAALQIITPMDDQAWEVLKPRLLAQRADAEQREKENAAHTQEELDDKRNLNAATKEAREAEDSDWDEIQAPVRACIAGLADEIIRDGWDDGEKVSRETCPKFAVEALTYIRKRFYAEVAKDTASARAAGKSPVVDPPQGPFTQKLTLENMKWIFDIKIKPHTERYRKEIFLCNGCDVTARYYGFEGVIQHYAAKHTNALSVGNIVVHWRAEWPEHPPFTSEPKTAKQGFFPGQPPPGHKGLQSGPPQSHQTQASAPVYGQPSWNASQPQGSQAPFLGANSGYAPSPGYQANFYLADPSQPFPATQLQQPSYNGTAQPQPAGLYNYNYGAYQSNGQAGYQPMQAPPFLSQHKAHLEDMARLARELWNATSNMKDTLSIVRVQTVIYHLAKRFYAKFRIPLPLSTFNDGLSNHKDMRPVRNVNGLICRVCHQGIGGYVAAEDERKSWSLPQLTSHFQSKHVEPFLHIGQYGQPPEWTVDMVLLPEPAAVSNLRAAIINDGQKYHLVNEAVPHLLGAPIMSQVATDAQPVWQDQNDVHESGPVESSAPYYGQTEPKDTAQDDHKGHYQRGIGAGPQHSNEPAVLCNYTQPPAVGTDSVSPATGFVPPEPASAIASVTLSRSDDSGARSSQGYRSGRDQHPRHSKKNKKKGGHNRDNSDEEARRRTEEEEKMAEEEAEREADVIRAMWAADRANAAGKSVVPEGDKLGKQEKQGKDGSTSKPPSKPSSKPDTPMQQNRFQSRPPRNSPRRDERASIPRDSRPHQGTPAPNIGTPRHQLSNVARVDSEAEKLPRDWQRAPVEYDRYDAAPPQEIQRRIPRSPGYTEYGRPPPPEQLRLKSPPRQPSETLYLPRPSTLMDDTRYERNPRIRDDYGPRDYPAPQGDLIEYEIIEYRKPDGTVWVEERPLRRIPNSEAERYYRDAPLPAPSGYDHVEPPPPGSYHRQQPPAPAAGQPILLSAGSYHRDQPPRPPPAEPYHTPHETAYSRAPPRPQGAESTMYDPRYPSDAAPRRNEPPPHQPLSQNAPAYYEEEYDPRFPAGPPSMSIPPPRTARYR